MKNSIRMKIENILIFRIVIIGTILLYLIHPVSAKELTPKQKVFQKELTSFLRQEGFFLTQKNESDVIYFKKEGVLHWITISDEDPFFVTLSRRGFPLSGPDAYEKDLVLAICNEINANHKSVKMYCDDNTASLQIEQYVSGMKEYMLVFYQNIMALGTADDIFEKLYNEKKSPAGSVPVTKSVLIPQPIVSTVQKPFDNMFFPVQDVYLGKTTTVELQNNGQIPIINDNQECTFNINGIIFKDTNGDTIVDYMYIPNSVAMPMQWVKAFKFEWELSYTSWMSRIKKVKMKPNILEKPKITGYEGRRVLKAMLKATSPSGLLEFIFDFDKGNPKGKPVSVFKPNSLYSISVKVK